MRRRIAGKLTSTYVDAYSEELHQLLLRNAAEARELRKQIRRIDKRLAKLGFAGGELGSHVGLNLDFARASMKASIYDQAVLEGVATSFPQTEEIIENGRVSGVTATDVQKVLNLKHAWEFVLVRTTWTEGAAFYEVLRHFSPYHLAPFQQSRKSAS